MVAQQKDALTEIEGEIERLQPQILDARDRLATILSLVDSMIQSPFDQANELRMELFTGGMVAVITAQLTAKVAKVQALKDLRREVLRQQQGG